MARTPWQPAHSTAFGGQTEMLDQMIDGMQKRWQTHPCLPSLFVSP